MPSLLLIVFVLQVLIHIINTVGASAIDDLLWILYNKLPTPTSKDADLQIKLRRELVPLKQELNATSSQDEFAKWARLRRIHDKKMAEYDEIANNLKSFKSSFDRTVNIARFLSTNGLRLFLQFWFARRPMYWIPRGWVPRYVEWALSFPRAPMGSVGIQVWGIACATVVQIVGAAVVAGLVLLSQATVRKKEEGVESEKIGAVRGKDKKEL